MHGTYLAAYPSWGGHLIVSLLIETKLVRVREFARPKLTKVWTILIAATAHFQRKERNLQLGDI